MIGPTITCMAIAWLRSVGLLRSMLPLVLAFALAPESMAQGEPRAVKVGIFLTSISSVTPSDGSFRAAGYAWFLDPTGTFDANRDFELISRSSTTNVFASTVLSNGSTYTAVEFDAVIDHAFDVGDYPFDSQVLRIKFESADSVSHTIFVPDAEDSQIAEFVRAPGWLIDSLSFEDRAVTYQTRFGYRDEIVPYSRVTFVVDIQRKLSPLLFEKFTGFFVALFITGLVLFIPVEELGTRVGVTTGSVFAAVFNRYRLEDAIGFDATFGIVDQVSFLTFSAILCVLMLSILTQRILVASGPVRARMLNFRAGGTIMAVHAVLIVIAFAIALT
ncbi:hypothetical protein [Martelella radicis]|uniref:Neurotransmitter-gated ion-channel ligand-binding domain-containing protein n=1 Tax=Martelella radicis TaxID=1397476 RepID=A0A7W6PAN8_9HYPH|nr:hypothetical protein [Martelella radicis]MBB4123055.1 hypothetical protein [Martelella radicis]